METKKLFIDKFREELDNGKYDKELSLPFMTKKLLLDSVESKIKRKIEKKSAPSMTDAEINLTIEEVKETAGATFYIFRKYGFLEEIDGVYQISEKGKRAMIEALKIM